MKFFTDKKLQNSTAHEEYEEYCETIWNDLPHDLKCIHGGMLSENLTAGQSHVMLHDARITSFELNVTDLKVSFNTDHNGGIRKVWFHYQYVLLIHLPSENVLGKKEIANPQSDIMCHEIEQTAEKEWTHTLLFASSEELVIRFKDFSMSFEDTTDGNHIE